MTDSHQGTDTGKKGGDGSPKSKETLRSVDEHYQRGDRLYATRTSDAYEAIERGTDETVCLWVLRHPLAPNSDAAGRFVSRLDLIGRLNTAVARIRCYGVDMHGTPFLVTDRIDGSPVINLQNAPFNVLQECFLEALRKVSMLHQRGIVLGDICEHSFVAETNTSRLHLVSILGTFEVEAHQTALLPPPNTLHYVAPEQRSGAGVEIASDVYALGVLGYRLFTGRYLFGDKPPLLGTEEQLRLAPAPSALNAQLPGWVDDVLGKCVETQPASRYRDAGEILATIERAIKTGVAPGGDGRWSQRTLVVRPQTRKAVAQAGASRTGLKTRPAEPEKAPRPRRTASVSKEGLLFTLLALAGVVAAGGLYLTVESLFEDDGTISRDFPIRPEDVPAELRQHFTEFYSTRLPVEHRREALMKIAESDDPFVYAVLVSAVKQVDEADLRQAVEEAIVQRIQKRDLKRTAEFLRKWFQAVAGSGQSRDESGVVALILRACDPQVPIDARTNAVQKAYADQPLVALQLASALALDTRPDEHFLALLRQLTMMHSGKPELRDKSVVAILITDRTLSVIFEKDIRELLPEMPPQDLTWVLGRLAEVDSPMLNDVATEIVRRNILPPFQEVFLTELTGEDRFALSGRLRQALVHGALNAVTSQDLMTIGHWYSPRAEPVLLAICALARDPETQLSAFDTLALHTLQTEPARSLVEWIRTNFWDYRGRAVKAIGVLGHVQIASREQLEYAFDMLMPFGGGGELLKVLAKSSAEDLIVLAIDRSGQVTSSDDLVALLYHSSPRVRITAIKALQGRNDLAVLQAILRAYGQEHDETVRKQYQDSHWVVNEGAKRP